MILTDLATDANKNVEASPAWVERYLALLGVTSHEPSLTGLSELIPAQFAKVPFENVTAMLRRGAYPQGPVPPVDPESMLTDWERGRGGGVCFEISFMFWRLLRALEYDATQILAQISFPDGHQASVVTLDGSNYLIDVGTGSPVLQPIPLEGVVELQRAGVSFRFRPGDVDGYWQQDRLVNDVWMPACTYDLNLPTEERRIAAYQRHHTYGETWVVDKLRMIAWRDDAGYSVNGNELTTLRAGSKQIETLTDLRSYERMATELFGVPALPIAEAIAIRPVFAPLG